MRQNTQTEDNTTLETPAAAETAQVHIVIILTYIVGLDAFSHIIAGSVEVLYLVSMGRSPGRAILGSFSRPRCLEISSAAFRW